MNEITTRILKILLLVFAVVLALSIFYHLFFNNYETENAIYYEVSDVSTFQGVYVRNETVRRYNGSGAVRYCVDDGEKLGVGSVIAEIYSNEEQIDLRRTIAEKEAELAMLSKLENPGTSENAQPAKIASLIDEQFRSMIRQREHGNISAVCSARQELTVLMSTYEKITNSAVDYQDRIVALEDEIARLSRRKTAPDDVIRAEKSAYFVSHADGYEAILTGDNVRQLTPDQLSAVTDDGSDNGSPSGGSQVIGKLIDDYGWYIVGVFDNTKLRLSEDDMATVRLESHPSDLRVSVVSLISAGDITKTQGVFRCEQLTGEVVKHRTERVEILRETVEGIRVPRSAIRFKNMEVEEKDDEGNVTTSMQNCMGVYVLVGETAEFRRIKEIYEDDTYYLSDLDAGKGFVELYDDIIVKGVMADGE
ncbi:MAG: hypothetical protein IKX57_04800 [Oscillospiraceae bacterium]|nr:hypothetical protein [Oscillospiraceae bacterium]MBR5722928.1 hypothetical protein [Oscillospiraceae bacterium]